MQKRELIVIRGIIQSYLTKREERLNFGNGVAEIARKCPKWKSIVAMTLLKMEEEKIVAIKLSEMEKKKIYVRNIFHIKLYVISCYWFKFEPNTKIIFLP